MVRRLKVLDLPVLEQIEAKYVKRFPWRVGWVANFGTLMERSVSEEPEGVMIAELDGEVVGSAIVRQRGVHPISGLTYGHILHLSVTPERLGQGIRDRLLRECEAYLRSRSCQSVQLSLPSDDSEDAQLFKQSGYRIAGWELERLLK